MLRLRTAAGIDLKDFSSLFGCDFKEKYSEPLKKVFSFLDVSEKTVKIKDENLFVQNSIIIEFFN